jgi:hypothetical protein
MSDFVESGLSADVGLLAESDPQRTRDKNYDWRLVPVKTARLGYHSISFHH